MQPAAVLGYSMGGILALRLAAEQPDAVSAVVPSSAGIVSTTRRAELWLAVTTALRPARLVAHAREAIARRQGFALRCSATGAPRSRATFSEAVLGFLEAQPEHTDVRRPARALVRDDPRAYLDRVLPGARRVGRARPAHAAGGRLRVRPQARAPLRVLPAAGHLWSASARTRARSSCWIG